MEIAEQGRAREHSGSGWVGLSKDNYRIAEWVDKREMEILYQILGIRIT